MTAHVLPRQAIYRATRDRYDKWNISALARHLRSLLFVWDCNCRLLEFTLLRFVWFASSTDKRRPRGLELLYIQANFQPFEVLRKLLPTFQEKFASRLRRFDNRRIQGTFEIFCYRVLACNWFKFRHMRRVVDVGLFDLYFQTDQANSLPCLRHNSVLLAVRIRAVLFICLNVWDGFDVGLLCL